MLLNFSFILSPLCEIINVFVLSSSVCSIFKNSSVPPSSSELSNTSSRINKLVLTEFFNLAIDLQVNSNDKSILIFSPSLNDEYEKLDNDNLKQKRKYGDLKKKYKNLKKKKKFSIKDNKTSSNVLACLICVVITELSVILIFYK